MWTTKNYATERTRRLRRNNLFLFLSFIFISFTFTDGYAWGFYAHKRINRLAVFTLPKELFPFYKYHIDYISEKAVNPDRRRYAVDGEAPRHYIDIDDYGDSAIVTLPKYWKQAVERYTEDTLNARGIVPWHIQTMKYRLTQAFKEKDVRKILLYSADIGHYIGDANVPLHTTSNYNGQKTNQVGIHGFWESRLPELFAETYDFYVGPPSYIKDTQEAAWNMVRGANAALDSVLTFEAQLSSEFPEDKKYVYEQRGLQFLRTYSRPYAGAYHARLHGQVERQMIKSILSVASFWYTCWVDAGQPELSSLINPEHLDLNRKELEEDEKLNLDPAKSRPHESSLTPLLIPLYTHSCHGHMH